MSHVPETKEGKESFFCSRIVFELYKLIDHEIVRSVLRKVVLKLEGGPWYSLTIRRIFRELYGVDVGLYTQGPCEMLPGFLAPGTTVGRYSSIFYTARNFNGNHPMNTKSTHPFFFNPILGKVKTDLVSPTKLVIGNDVWIGHNVILLNTVERIGDGAVIGAGAVVSFNVPPYAVVTGYPARVSRMRFSQTTIQKLLEEKWWLKTIDELSGELEAFREPLEEDGPVR